MDPNDDHLHMFMCSRRTVPSLQQVRVKSRRAGATIMQELWGNIGGYVIHNNTDMISLLFLDESTQRDSCSMYPQ